ncbi:serine--tRNA ligase [Thermococcus sp. M39]|uniref:serine--tRNA ligase n=1 Tax=unclassified Thermococcus TaxID=2627626 RepID=UPI00143C8627|nr:MULTISPECIES: serine--tRNA ligase [unclassified Thermococcus]NJE07995.1 serine--tRNA ligase [Thermococcus sp. M39]NJE13697.1 serine--tRNA ligase [Thermococcus sp. LS2]
MLDIKLIRENPDIVRGDLIKRGELEKLKWIDEILELDKKWRENLRKINQLRRERNRIAVEIGKRKKAGESVDDLLAKSKEIVKQIEDIERENEEIRKKIDFYLWRLPNITHESVPIGKDDTENVPIKFWGKARVWKGHLESFLEQSQGKMEYEILEWKPKLHVDLLEILRGADFERAAKVSGSRFYYLLNEIVILDLALIRFALDKLIEKGFTPVIPPYMVRRYVEEGVTTFDDFENVIYKVEGEDLYLIPTAEHPLAGMHANEIIDGKDLPLLYVGVSPCFRKEAGTAGKDTKGIFRVHQFHKVEQFVYSRPEESWEWHEKLLQNAEELFQELGIPYRVVNICTGDLGYVAAKKYDIEAWMPGQGKFREVVSCSNCTDWQARRLNIRFRDKTHEKPKFVHTLNSTAIATSRTIVAILENFQEEDGTVKIPKALWKYTGFKEIVPADKKEKCCQG